MTCTKCPLHEFAKTNCFQPKGSSNPKMVIYLDHPHDDDDRKGRIGESDGTRLLLWMLKRMSVSLDDVSIEFALKCRKPKNQLTKKPERLEAIRQCKNNLIAIKPKVIVVMGSIACEGFMGGQLLKNLEGAYWNTFGTMKETAPHTYVTYSPAYAIKTPSETVRIYRILFMSAKEAGLSPKFNSTIKSFNYES